MTSGNVPVFSAYWFNTGYMSTSVYGGFCQFFFRFRPPYFCAMLGSTADSCSCVRPRRLLLFTLQKTVESPQLQFIKVVDFFFMVHRQVSMVLLFSRTIGIPQLQFLNEVIDIPVVPSRSHARCVQRLVPWFPRI